MVMLPAGAQNILELAVMESLGSLGANVQLLLFFE
jgi:hypothetical protein